MVRHTSIANVGVILDLREVFQSFSHSRFPMFSNSHNVEGVKYLRADYGIRCDTARWWGMAAYAGTWYLAYVMGFPLFVLYKLWSYRKSSAKHEKEHVDLRFLLVDYKSFAPVLLWEGTNFRW